MRGHIGKRQGKFGVSWCYSVYLGRDLDTAKKKQVWKRCFHTRREAEGTIWHTSIHLSLNSGLRRSELMGLRWRSVGFERGTLEVNYKEVEVQGVGVVEGSPKSDVSNRVISLSKSPLNVLRSHKERQRHPLDI